MSLKELARKLRHNSTDAERKLWQYLRNKQLCGCKFRRQVVFEPYIVDFVCFNNKLVIEVDGGQHSDNKLADIKRVAFLYERGYRVLRFWNNEVLNNIESVIWKVEQELNKKEKNNA